MAAVNIAAASYFNMQAPTIRFVKGYYYVSTGGHNVWIARTKNLREWECPAGVWNRSHPDNSKHNHASQRAVSFFFKQIVYTLFLHAAIFDEAGSFCINRRSSNPTIESCGPGGHFAPIK